MKEIETLDELFEKSSNLTQILFFAPEKVGPIDKNPAHRSEWQDYLDLQKKINLLVEDKAKTAVIVVASTRIFIKDRGRVKSYYQERVMATENYDQRIEQIVASGKNITLVERL